MQRANTKLTRAASTYKVDTFLIHILVDNAIFLENFATKIGDHQISLETFIETFLRLDDQSSDLYCGEWHWKDISYSVK